MRPQPTHLLPAILVGSLILAACGSDDDSSAEDASASTEAATADSTATADSAADTTTDTEASAPDSAAAGTESTGDECTDTVEDGVLTVATGEPAFFPWVIDDDPTTGEGFESAVAYAVADQMGYPEDSVTWVRSTFDAAIQPGAKDYDVNIQQFSITDERRETIDMSLPYFTSNQAIVALEGSAAEGATSIADLKDVKFGAQSGTTSLDFINDVIQPSQEAFVYDDNVGAKAALEANQIDAAVFDLPTALFVSAVEIDGSSVIGQFPADSGGTTDQFGFVLEKDSPLTACVDAALQTLTDDGSLDALTQEWLSDNTGAPVISE